MSGDGASGDKSALRRLARSRRDAIPRDQRERWSNRAVALLVERFPLGGRVLAYSAFGSELDLAALADAVGAAGGVLHAPRVEGRDIVAVEVHPGHPTEVSRFGITEPTGPAVAPELLDLVVVPGLAFDPTGHRVGYGAGYYDRFLPLLREGVPTVGVCFGAQLFDRVPHDAHDIAVDCVLTERGVADGDPRRDAG